MDEWESKEQDVLDIYFKKYIYIKSAKSRFKSYTITSLQIKVLHLGKWVH